MIKFPIKKNRDKVAKDLKETTLSLGNLGKKYGVTRQALSQSVKREKIIRSPKPPQQTGHFVETCPTCQEILQVTEIPHSEFLTGRTIRERLDTEIEPRTFHYHLKELKKSRIGSSKIGTYDLKEGREAYVLYFKDPLQIQEIGLRVGLKNFSSIIRNHRRSGWEVPPSLYMVTPREKPEVHRGPRQSWRAMDKIPTEIIEEIFPKS